jgi:hypothetical protein
MKSSRERDRFYVIRRLTLDILTTSSYPNGTVVNP